MSKNMFIARSTDERILERGESGGAVTAVLKCALENGDIDGVVTVRSKKGDRYSGLPVLINVCSPIVICFYFRRDKRVS